MSAGPFLVSVIIAVRNGERYLAEAIESVLAQSHRAFELILVDDGSSDDTERIAASYSRVRYVRQTGQGAAVARNTGIEAARGELVAFLSHDDLWLPDKLSRQVEYLRRHAQTQYTVTNFKYFLEPGCLVPAGFKRELLDKSLVGRIPETLLARKSLFDRIGKFSSEFTIADDVDWFARAKDHEVPMAIIPEVLLLKRLHNTNLSSNAQVNSQELLELLKNSVLRKRQQPRQKSDERG